MKTIELKDLPKEFNFKNEEQLHAHLLAQDAIRQALPNVAEWKCKQEEKHLDKNKLDARHLQVRIADLFALQSQPFKLSEIELIELIQVLVSIAYMHERLKIFTTEMKAIQQQLEAVSRVFQFERNLPVIKQKTGGECINLDYLMPMMLAALAGFNQADLIKIKLGIEEVIKNVDALVDCEDSDIRGPREYAITNLMSLHKYFLEQSTPNSQELEHNKLELSAYFSISNTLPAEDDWVKKVIDSIYWSIQNKQPPCLNFYAFQLSPQRVNEYVDLQNKIAKLIPLESHRPTIIIHFLGKKRQSTEVPDLGLLGGMGPLSDAHIVESMFENTKNNKVNILLISAPTSNFEDMKDTPEIFHSHKWFRIQRLHELRRAQCHQYAMLSNTAHLYQFGFKLVTGNIVSMVWGAGNIIHLVNEIANKLKADLRKNKRVMILATNEGVVGDLYCSLLKNELKTESIFYQFEETTISAENLPEEQQFLQQTLIKMKKNEVDQKVLHNFYSRLSVWILKNKPTHVLVACTELNLLLSKNLSTEVSVMDSLRTSLGQHFPRFIDTEQEMVTILNEARKKHEISSDWSALMQKIEALVTENDQQETVKNALLEALNMDDHVAAVAFITESTNQLHEYDRVNTYLGGNVSANSFYGRFANAVGTTKNQPGQKLKDATTEVLNYLESRRAALTNSAPK